MSGMTVQASRGSPAAPSSCFDVSVLRWTPGTNLTVPRKELVVGRRLDSGAPLTGDRESDVPDLAATVGGISVIPPNAHIALARHRNDDEQFLRRPYNYDDAPSSDQHDRQWFDFRRIPTRSRPAIHPRAAAAWRQPTR